MIKNPKRVRDILTPQGATPHPHRLLALVANPPPARSPRKRGRTSHPPTSPTPTAFPETMAKKSFGWNFPRPKGWQKKARVSVRANISARARRVGDGHAQATMPKREGGGSMSESVLDYRKARAQAWFETLRDDICAALEALETALPARAPLADRVAGRFFRTPWTRTEHEGNRASSAE